VVADGIYIHSLRDMKLLHQIPNSLHEAPSVCVLSSGMPVLGQDTPSYLAFSNSGDMGIFDIVNLVSMHFDPHRVFLAALCFVFFNTFL